MLDLKFIRENIDQVREAVAKRQDTAPLDEILELDSERRQKVLELENSQSRKDAKIFFIILIIILCARVFLRLCVSNNIKME